MPNATTSAPKGTPLANPAPHGGFSAGRVVALALAFVSGGAAMSVLHLSTQLATPRPSSVDQEAVAASRTLPPTGPTLPAAVAEAPAAPAESPIVLPPVANAPMAVASAPERVTTVQGVLEAAPGALVKLPLATSQPVAFIDVQPGDKIEKGWQVFSHWESPERLHAMKNEWERAKKQLDLAKIRSTAADQTLARLQKLGATVPSQELQDAEATALLRRGEIEAAELGVSETHNRFVAMEAEFKQAFVTSPIEGIVASVDVVPGERRQVGGTFRGVTVIDPHKLVCRSAVTTKMARQLREDLLAQRTSATILCDGSEYPATLATVGVLADSATGLVPVWLDVPNEDQKLFCGGRVEVRFRQESEQKP